MRVLALDTTTRAGSVALVEDDRVIDQREGDGSRTYAERLPRSIVELLKASGVELSDVDLFAVAAGPGSFTGLRIGIATIQGLALVEGRPVAAISALEAHAQIGTMDQPANTIVGVWMDAQRSDVFSALYRLGRGSLYDPDRLIELDPPCVDAPLAVLERWAPEIKGAVVRLVGDGAERYQLAALGAGEDAAVARVDVVPARPLAGAIGRMAVVAARLGRVVHPAGVQPLYIRRPDAEIDRDRRR